jgi:hypothetical protein
MKATTFQAAIDEAMEIASTAHRGAEVHTGRYLWAFDTLGLYVVAPKDVTRLGLAILVLEQVAISHAQKTAYMSTGHFQSLKLQDLPTAGGLQ